MHPRLISSVFNIHQNTVTVISVNVHVSSGRRKRPIGHIDFLEKIDDIQSHYYLPWTNKKYAAY